MVKFGTTRAGEVGSRRMHRKLKGRGHRIDINRVERVMREVGIRARHKRRFKATADSKHSMPAAANLLARNFTPPAPNQVWTGNIAYIATGEGWLYLAIHRKMINAMAMDGADFPWEERFGKFKELLDAAALSPPIFAHTDRKAFMVPLLRRCELVMADYEEWVVSGGSSIAPATGLPS